MNEVLINRLLVLAKMKSFSKAADYLFVSRPALTQQVRNLEKELGFQVFHRTYEGIVPTQIGIKFLKGLEQMNEFYDNLVYQCREEAGCMKNSLVIGTLSNFPSIILPGICAEFKKSHPEVKVIFKDYSIQDCFQKLADGDMDLTVEYMEAYYYNSYPELTAFHLMDSQYYCSVSVSDSLVQKEEISFEDLRGRKLMMYRRGISVTDDLLRDYLEKNEPEITIYDIENYSSSYANYCSMENIVVLLYARHQELPGMRTIPTTWNYSIPFGMVYRKNPSKVVNEFIKTAKKYISDVEMTLMREN